MSVNWDSRYLPAHTRILDSSRAVDGQPYIHLLSFHEGLVGVDHDVETPYERHGLSLLSPAEETVLVLGSIGMSEAATAAMLIKSEETISSHRKRFCKKLGTTGENAMSQATAIALEIGLLIVEEPIPLPSKVHPNVKNIPPGRLEVMEGLSQGMTREQIALTVGARSTSTVKNRMAQMYNRYALAGSAGAVLFGAMSGYISSKKLDLSDAA